MKRTLILIILLLASPSWAATYYVDNRCANNGAGTSNLCAGSAGDPGAFNSMANTVAKAGGYADGDIIDGNGLTYYEYFTFPSSGTSDYITLQNFTLDGTVSIDGTYSYYYDTSDTTGTYSDGSQLTSNPGFETFTGTVDDDTSDDFASWTEVNSAGNLTEGSTTKHGGDYGVKLTYASAASYVYHSSYAMPGQTYTVTFWTRGDGTKAGMVAPYTGTGSAISFTMDGSSYTGATSTGVTGTDYAQKTITFTVPSSTTTVGIRLYSPVSAGTAYFDDVVITVTNGWVNVSGNIWKKYCNSTPQIMLEDGNMLTPVVYANEAAVVSGIVAGQYSRVHNTAAIRVLYYYASDGAAPTTHALRISQYFDDANTERRSLIKVDGKNYIKVKDVTLKHWGAQSNAVGYYGLYVNNSDHFYADNVTSEWNNYGAAMIGGNTNLIAELNLLHNSCSGLILSGGGSLDLTGTYDGNGSHPYYIGTSLDYDTYGDRDNIGVGGTDGGTYTSIILHDAILKDAGTPVGQTAKGSAFYFGSTTHFVVDHLEVLRCKLINSSWTSFAGDSTANIKELVFSGNEVYGNRYAHAITFTTSLADETISYAYLYNNTIHDNPDTSENSTGLHIGGTVANSVKMKNNIIYNNGSVSKTHNDLWIEQVSVLSEADYNIYYRSDAGEMIYGVTTSYHNDDLAAWRTATSKEAHTLFADPRLTSTMQGKLLPGSPAINAGVDVGLTTDIEGRAVPQELTPDIGAYEYIKGQHLITQKPGMTPWQ